jgi:hypothetical protein
VLVIFALSAPDNAAAPEPTLTPIFVGFTMAGDGGPARVVHPELAEGLAVRKPARSRQIP